MLQPLMETLMETPSSLPAVRLKDHGTSRARGFRSAVLLVGAALGLTVAIGCHVHSPPDCVPNDLPTPGNLTPPLSDWSDKGFQLEVEHMHQHLLWLGECVDEEVLPKSPGDRFDDGLALLPGPWTKEGETIQVVVWISTSYSAHSNSPWFAHPPTARVTLSVWFDWNESSTFGDGSQMPERVFAGLIDLPFTAVTGPHHSVQPQSADVAMATFPVVVPTTYHVGHVPPIRIRVGFSYNGYLIGPSNLRPPDPHIDKFEVWGEVEDHNWPKDHHASIPHFGELWKKAGDALSLVYDEHGELVSCHILNTDDYLRHLPEPCREPAKEMLATAQDPDPDKR